jgi:presenilin-like A22 family membrane protease
LFTLDTKEEIFVLGSADIILPSILVVSVFLHYSLMETLSEGEALVFPILGALLCSLLALAGLFIATRQREAPALPYASVGILGFFITEFIRVL